MKKILAIGLVVSGLLVAGTAFGAMRVGPGVLTAGGLWGLVSGPMDTQVYRLKDPDNGTTCYFAYFSKAGMVMDCVK